MARIALVGVGSIGGALAGLLQAAGGHHLQLCTRRPLTELRVRTPEAEHTIEAVNLTSPELAEPADWVIVATKAYDAASTAEWFGRLCSPTTHVALVQNGVEHRERFLPWLPAAQLLPVVIDCPVERKPDGLVVVRGSVLLKTEDTAQGRSFLDLFAQSGAECMAEEDFKTAAWWKLAINVVGALNALTSQPVRVLWSEPMQQLSRGLVRECVAVARAEGAALTDSIVEEVVNLYQCHPADSVNSLLADRLAGRNMEYDARNGAVVRLGAKHGIATPLNQMATTLLEAVNGKRP